MIKKEKKLYLNDYYLSFNNKQFINIIINYYENNYNKIGLIIDL